jgi:hypothetical protein
MVKPQGRKRTATSRADLDATMEKAPSPSAQRNNVKTCTRNIDAHFEVTHASSERDVAAPIGKLSFSYEQIGSSDRANPESNAIASGLNLRRHQCEDLTSRIMYDVDTPTLRVHRAGANSMRG